MALPAVSPSIPASPQVIGNAFVQQYYKILHDSPELVHKFYQDSSILCRPDPNGAMTSVTTTQAINDLILSLDFSNCYTEIETVDSQISYKDGMLIIVTGSFTGGDSIKRKFTQSFFLAPQEHGGYFVLNDVFRVLNETQAREMIRVLVNGSGDDATTAPLTRDLDSHSQEQNIEEAQLPVAEADNDDKDIQQSEVNSIIQNEVALIPSVPDSESTEHLVSEAAAAVAQNAEQAVSEVAAESAEQPVSEVAAAVAQGDAPKKSYAFILQLKAMKASTSSLPVCVPARKEKAAAASTEKPVMASTMIAHSPESNVPASNNATENPPREEEGYSIYIKNLPLNATIEQVEAEFKRFGTIKPGGVQVRSHKVEGFCFGFVEFDLLTSMQTAIEASPIMIGGRQSYIEEKRTTTRVVNGVVTTSGNGARGRGRFLQGRGGFRNDNFRGRGNFGPNTSYRRNEYRSRFEFSGRGRGTNNYQYRVYQNSNGSRIGSSNEHKQTAVAAN